MIEAFDIDNVQNHKHSRLEFHPHLNIIVGSSNQGKSAIIRGAEWALLNNSQIDLTKWDISRGDACQFGVQFDKGFVLRSKSKSKNIYVAAYGDEDSGTSFEAFRKGVPQKVSEVARMSEINISSQGEPYLFFSKSAGEVARMINRAVGNENIDIYFKRVDKIIYDSKKRKAFVEGEAKKEQESIDDLDWIDDAKKKIGVIDGLMLQYENRKSKVLRLEQLISNLKEDLQAQEDINGWLTIEKVVCQISSMLEKFLSKFDKTERLQGLVKTCYTLKKEQESITSWFDLSGPVAELIEMKNKLSDRRNKTSQLKNAIDYIHRMQKSQSSAESLRGNAEKKLQERLSALKICPFCSQKIKDPRSLLSSAL